MIRYEPIEANLYEIAEYCNRHQGKIVIISQILTEVYQALIEIDDGSDNE